MNIAQLTQDVIDGKENTIKALTLLIDEKIFLDKCISKVSEIVDMEKNFKLQLRGSVTWDAKINKIKPEEKC